MCIFIDCFPGLCARVNTVLVHVTSGSLTLKGLNYDVFIIFISLGTLLYMLNSCLSFMLLWSFCCSSFLLSAFYIINNNYKVNNCLGYIHHIHHNIGTRFYLLSSNHHY